MQCNTRERVAPRTSFSGGLSVIHWYRGTWHTKGGGCGHVGVVRVASDVPNHKDLRMAKGSQDAHSVRSASGGDTEASRKEIHALTPPTHLRNSGERSLFLLTLPDKTALKLRYFAISAARAKRSDRPLLASSGEKSKFAFQGMTVASNSITKAQQTGFISRKSVAAETPSSQCCGGRQTWV